MEGSLLQRAGCFFDADFTGKLINKIDKPEGCVVKLVKYMIK